MAKIYGKNYNPDIVLRILREFGELFKNGELPSLSQLSTPSRTLNKYLQVMETCFLIRRFPIHPLGVGTDCFLVLDSGLCRHLMKTDEGEGPMLSIMRHTIWNELVSLEEYQGRRFRPHYYKSAKGSPIDWIDEEEKVAYKIVFHGRKNSRENAGTLKYLERSLQGAMKTLGYQRGFLIAAVDTPEIPKNTKKSAPAIDYCLGLIGVDLVKSAARFFAG